METADPKRGRRSGIIGAVSGREGRTIRFDAFEADLAARELRKRGVLVKLQDQPFQVLAALLEKPGEVVTREEFQERLWGDDTYVDFDKSLSAAVNKVRQALDDSRTRPRFVETLPKVGYRFIGTIEQRQAQTAADDGPAASKPGARRGRLLLVAGLAAAVAAWAYFRGSESTEPHGPLQAVPLTSYEGAEEFPTFSPDGSQVAFAWARQGDDATEVFVKSLGSEQPRQLTDHDGASSSHPAWSPDGESIAYIRRDDDDGTDCELRLISPTGAADRSLTRLLCPVGFANFSQLAWSPDGSAVVYPDKPDAEQPWALFAIDVGSRESWRLTDPPAETIGDGAPGISWCGDRIAFIRRHTAYSASEVYVAGVDSEMKPTGEATALSEDGSSLTGAASLVWTADDSYLVIPSSGTLWRVPPAGGQPEQLLVAGGGLRGVSLDPARGRLAFGHLRPDADIWSLNLKTGETRPLVTSTRTDWFHAISPDGERIAWTSQRSGPGSEIWVCNADGSDPRQLTDFGTQSGAPTWSPDGRSIAFDTRLRGNGDIYVVSPEGGEPQPLIEGPEDTLQPHWSLDGEAIYFTSHRGGAWDVMSFEIKTGHIETVAESSLAWPRQSPDGRFLYYTGDKFAKRAVNGLFRKQLPDGREMFLREGARHPAPVENGLYFIVNDTIRYLDFESGEESEVLNPEERIFNLSISPDRRILLYTVPEPRSTDLMLVEGIQ